MSIIIPSKQIYSTDNKKVKNNVILGTTVEAPMIEIPETDINTFEWQPFTMSNTGGAVTFIVFSKNEIQSSENTEVWDSTEGAVLYSNIRFKVKSSDYIDLKNLGFSFSCQYVYGKSADGTGSYRTLISVENAMSKTINTDVEGYYHTLIPSKDNVPFLYMTSEITYPDDDLSPSKDLTVIFSIPIEYWSPKSESGKVDCCFITNMKIVLSAPMFNFSNTQLVEFGKRGDKTFDIPSNNLSVAKYKRTNIFEHISNKTINSYKNGKETATIRASIGEYYDENGELAISTKNKVKQYLKSWSFNENEEIQGKDIGSGFIRYSIPLVNGAKPFSFIGNATNLSAGTYTYEIDYTENAYGRIGLNPTSTPDDFDPVVQWIFVNNPNKKGTFELTSPDDLELYFISDIKDQNSSAFTFKIRILKQGTEDVIKMSFEIGDKVTPMVRRADGTDAPMSRTTSGTAKQFRVCGTKIYYDGAVWQELTLQEV